MTFCFFSFLKIHLFEENCFSLKIYIFLFFKTDSLVLDPDPNWAKVLDPDPNSMYLDPQHCYYLINCTSEEVPGLCLFPLLCPLLLLLLSVLWCGGGCEAGEANPAEG